MNNASSIAAEIAKVLTSKSSYATKRKELIKIGVRANEINLVLPAPPRKPRKVFTYCYGIELETLCPSYDVVRDGLTQYGIDVNDARCYFHSNGNARFELKSDSSIRADENTRGCRGIEIVSSVLKSTDRFKTVKKSCKALVAAGAKVNKSTGFHVHISTVGMNDEWFSNVFVNYAHAELVIDSFMASSRRGDNNTYCHTLRNHLSRLESAHTIMDVRRILCDRYHKVNAEAYRSHGTIEFRQHQGTVNEQKVTKWVEFCAALIAWSKDNRLDHDIETIDDMAWLTPSLKAFFKGRVQAISAAA